MFTILIPTDFSASATNAVRYAVQLTKKLPCKIIFFHGELIPVPPNADVSVIPVEIDHEAARKTLIRNIQRILSSLKVKHDPERFNYDVSDGVSISLQILEAAEKHKADLIMMGTQGASGLAKFIVGSNTTEIIARTKIPVIAIPSGYRFKPLKKILFASDLQQFNDQLNMVLPWAKLFNAVLEIFHVSNEMEGELKMISKAQQTIQRRSYKKIKFFVLTLTSGKPVAQELRHTLQQHDADMVIMFRHEHNWLGRMFLKSTTEKLAFETSVPLLAFHSG